MPYMLRLLGPAGVSIYVVTVRESIMFCQFCLTDLERNSYLYGQKHSR